MQDSRWTTVTPTQFAQERAALEHVRRLLPDTEPYRAWSNFTCTAETGHVHEVDLLVATPSGSYLVETKSLSGRLTNSGTNWLLSNDSVRTFDNPLHLADLKGKRLRSLLNAQALKDHVPLRIPFIQGAVFLSLPSLQIALTEHHFMAHYGDRLEVGTRLDVIRQLAEAVAYAHGRRLHHRALSARSVLVLTGHRSRGQAEIDAWLRPPGKLHKGDAKDRGLAAAAQHLNVASALVPRE
ncbi:NERD domain-containing protein [Micromonospora rubida]|uniref:NERD domain-containing protein n=1 Tax=Micromonospora rubida TaxID=2697657 RepID=UPI00191C3C6C|nr:NERD domain-containing protein [Micromonospora rubida]